jgi:4-alpha-glucanotransferase
MADDGFADKIARLARLCGIAAEYRDIYGVRRPTSLATCQALLTAMGVPWQDPVRLAEEIRHRRARPFRRLLEPVTVVFPEAGPLLLRLSPWLPGADLPGDFEIWGEIRDEQGELQGWQAAPGGPVSPPRPAEAGGFRVRLALPLPEGLAWGYYELRLTVKAGGREETGTGTLIVAPCRTYLPEILARGRRLWGLNLPLYALRSPGNWGIGDFTDLEEVLAWAGGLGAAFVGVNPLHALSFGSRPDPSPYSPASRLFLNFLYLDLERVPELQDSPAAGMVLASPEFQAAVARLRRVHLVAYPEVLRRKRQVLPWLFQAFLKRHGPPTAPWTARGREFARYLAGAGDSLARFGLYQALAERYGRSDWRRWPQAYQDPGGPAVAAYGREHPQEVQFHQYVQWLAAAQLGEAWDRARQAGLAFSLYQDLALGVAPGGFETWAYPKLFARDVALGAPPDAFNPRGQNWGLPPLIPEGLRESGYRLFIETLRRNCPPEGLLRLDHAMGLFRLFWIPRGREPREGAYVHYPVRELLAILALESHRSRTLIIGEDLGTITPAIRRGLDRAGLFSYRVFYFERNHAGAFRDPEDYPERAMAAVTTHDLPTLAGYWQGKDVKLKERYHLYPEPARAGVDLAAREQDRRRLVEALGRRGLLPAGSGPKDLSPRSCPAEVRIGVLDYLAQSRAALLEVRLEEVFGLTAQQNLPGTTRKHPNWRQKLPVNLKDLRRAPEGLRLTERMDFWGRGLRSTAPGPPQNDFPMKD